MKPLQQILQDMLNDDETYDLLKNSKIIGAVGFYDEKETLEKWEIIFYDDIEDKAFKINVDNDLNYEIYESELLDEKFKGAGLDPSHNFLNEEEVLKIAFAYFMEHYKDKEINSMFLVLDVIEKRWQVNLITPMLSVIQISLDMNTGNVLEDKEVTLAHVSL